MKAALYFGCAVMLGACGGSDGNLGDASGDGPNGDASGDGNNTNDGGNDAGNEASNDAGNDTSDSGSFNVAGVPCLVLWLDAAKGVTQMQNIVSAWADQSGQNNNAGANAPLIRPQLNMSAINNLPAIHFNQGQGQVGNMLVIADSASLQWGHQDFGVWVVARFDNNPNNGVPTGVGVLYSKYQQGGGGTPVGPFLWGNNGTGNPFTAGASGGEGPGTMNWVGQNAMYNDGMARDYAFRRKGNAVELRVNGKQVAMATQANPVDVSAVQTFARIGADGDATIHRLNGDVAEVIACKGTISDPDLQGIEGYLKSKYNLP